MKHAFWIGLVCLTVSASVYASDQLPDLEGVEFASSRKIDLTTFRGEVVYLDFWAAWCPPCRQSLPFMEELHQQYGRHGLKIVAVNIDERKRDAWEFLKAHPISYTNLYDPGGKIGKRLKVTAMPTAFLIDRGGRIVSRHVGFDREYSESLKRAIVALLSAER